MLGFGLSLSSMWRVSFFFLSPRASLTHMPSLLSFPSHPRTHSLFLLLPPPDDDMELRIFELHTHTRILRGKGRAVVVGML
jgi:hypothetical protein